MPKTVVYRAAIWGFAGVAALTGCTGSEGSAGPTTTVRDLDKIEIFNPCRGDLSGESLRAAGLDPATLDITTDPPTGVSAWRVCSWVPSDNRYGSGERRVGVFSTSHLLDDIHKKESATVLGETTVNSRRGLVSVEKNDPDSCYVSFEAEQGMFEINVGWLSTEDPHEGDLCEMAALYAAALEPHLPR